MIQRKRLCGGNKTIECVSEGKEKKWSANMVSIANKNEILSMYITFIRYRLMKKKQQQQSNTIRFFHGDTKIRSSGKTVRRIERWREREGKKQLNIKNSSVKLCDVLQVNVRGAQMNYWTNMAFWRTPNNRISFLPRPIKLKIQSESMQVFFVRKFQVVGTTEVDLRLIKSFIQFYCNSLSKLWLHYLLLQFSIICNVF